MSKVNDTELNRLGNAVIGGHPLRADPQANVRVLWRTKKLNKFASNLRPENVEEYHSGEYTSSPEKSS